MFSAITPALRSSGQFLAPVVRSGGRDAIRLLAATTVIYGASMVVVGSYLGTRKVTRTVGSVGGKIRRAVQHRRLQRAANTHVPTYVPFDPTFAFEITDVEHV